MNGARKYWALTLGVSRWSIVDHVKIAIFRPLLRAISREETYFAYFFSKTVVMQAAYLVQSLFSFALVLMLKVSLFLFFFFLLSLSSRLLVGVVVCLGLNICSQLLYIPLRNWNMMGCNFAFLGLYILRWFWLMLDKGSNWRDGAAIFWRWISNATPSRLCKCAEKQHEVNVLGSVFHCIVCKKVEQIQTCAVKFWMNE